MGTIRKYLESKLPPPQTATATSTTGTAPAHTYNAYQALTSNSTATKTTTSSATTTTYTATKNYKCATFNLNNLNTPSTLLLPPSTNAASTYCYQKQKQKQPQQQQHYLRTMLITAFVVLFLNLIQTTIANPIFVDNPSLAQFQSGRNIRHLPCIVRKSGRSGVCMFAIDCIKQNGTHLGTCIDRFYFGSCCQLKENTPLFAQEISDNSIDQNTISHFAHESTTLPTSALFKLTTQHPNRIHSNVGGSSSISETLKNVTQSYTSNKVGSTSSATTSEKPHKPSRRPPLPHTTHKVSQFVVRTTAKPTVAPTTIKPPRRKTTVTRPILTTTEKIRAPPPSEQRIEATTQPTKFVTFQIVETTTSLPTDATKLDEEIAAETTFQPIFHHTRRPHPTVHSSSSAPIKPETLRPKPQGTRKPAKTTTTTTTTTKPTTSKRPSVKPTSKPIAMATVEKIQLLNATTIHVHKTPDTTTTIVTYDGLPTTLLDTKLPTHKPTSAQQPHITHAPRPKPKPTAEIVKVPKPVVSNESTTSAPAPTTASTTTQTKVTRKPTTQVQSSSSTTTTRTTTTTTTTTTPKPKPIIISTTGTTSTSTTTTTTTKKPKPPKTTTTTTTTTTSRPITLTTEAPRIEVVPSSTTTLKPGLITWTNIDGEPILNATTGATDWQSPAWMPLSTTAPATSNKTIAEAAHPATATDASSSSSTTERIIISVSTTISEVMSSDNITLPEKHEKPTKTTTSTTTTKAPKPTKTTTSSTTTTTTTTTESPLTMITDAAGIIDITTENFFGTGIGSTTDYVTDDYNGTMGSTTMTSVNSLEGMDYKQVCGRRMFPEPRIVGGSNAAFGRWPWQISLRQWRTSTYLHKCGAALLNENWAITAAHCVDNVPPSDLLLRLGEYDLAEEEEPYGYQERRVQIVASHPQFDPRTFEYDLALLRFYEPVVFQPNIIPVCVPESDMDFIGQTAFVTGWGRLYEDGPLPSVLQEVAVPVINNTICETMYRTAGYIEHIPHIFICAGWKKGGYDSCEGDSGGPMVLQREEDKRFQLGGVISWGIGCAEANQPGVYTRISEFRDWINQILQF